MGRLRLVGCVVLGCSLLLGCSRENAGRCVPGASSACACPGGQTGAQTCQSDGTFGACGCMTAPEPTATPEKPPPVFAAPEPVVAPVLDPPRRPAVPRAAPTAPPQAPPPTDLPETPDRGTVRTALQSVSGDVRACGTGQGGTAMVTIVFANTGRVTASEVNGIPPGPVVGCVMTAVRRATLPPFSRATFSVTYPYPLN